MKGEELLHFLGEALKEVDPTKKVKVRVVVGLQTVDLTIIDIGITHPKGDLDQPPYLILTAE